MSSLTQLPLMPINGTIPTEHPIHDMLRRENSGSETPRQVQHSNLRRRISRLEGQIAAAGDGSGLVPYSREWLNFWMRWASLRLRGEEPAPSFRRSTLDRILFNIASAFPAAGRDRDPGHSEEVGLRAQEISWRAGRRVLDCPASNRILARGAAPGQHVSHPYGPKRPGGELN